MPWQRVAGRRTKKAAGSSGSQNSVQHSLAQEILGKLLSGSFMQQSPQASKSAAGILRRPEWRCQECFVTNYEDRTKCRMCAVPRGGARASIPPPRSFGARSSTPTPVPPGATQTPCQKGMHPQQYRPGQQADIFRRAAAAARKAGAPAAAVQPLEAEEQAARLRQAEARTISRLEQAKMTVARADAAVLEAEQAIETAQQRLEVARTRAETAKQRFQQEESELAARAIVPLDQVAAFEL